MATYEVLEPGGHAQLVSDIKTYVNRADGVGTTQLADESVTMDKLGEDVIDELDDIMHDGDPLNGNALFGELAEGALLTTDDAYAAPPKGVSVYGKSTQVQTTGKNLFDKSTAASGYINSSGGVSNSTTTYHSDYIDVTSLTTITGSSISSAGTAYQAFYDANKSYIGNEHASGGNITMTVPENAKYVRLSVPYANLGACQLEAGSAVTSYEPYSGGKASPRLDWPQEIKCVDDLTLRVCGKNLLPITLANLKTYNTGTWNGNSYTHQGITYTVVEKNGLVDSIVANGTAGSTESLFVLHPFTRGFLLDQTQYILHGCPSGGSSSGDGYRMYVNNSSYGSGINDYHYDAGSGTTFTTQQDNYTVFRIFVRGTTVSNIVFKPQLEIGSTSTAYAPYTGASVSIPLSNHIARSLPDGTRDTLTLSYIEPSTEHDGWGVFSAELVQVTDTTTLDGSEGWNAGGPSYEGEVGTDRFARPIDSVVRRGNVNKAKFSLLSPTVSVPTPTATWDNYNIWSHPDQNVWACILNDNQVHVVFDNATIGIDPANDTNTQKTTKILAWLAENPITVVYPLATPITTDLGTVELPILPNPLTAWADGGSAQPTLAMEYERDVNIVIEQLEAQIAELLTS